MNKICPSLYKIKIATQYEKIKTSEIRKKSIIISVSNLEKKEYNVKVYTNKL